MAGYTYREVVYDIWQSLKENFDDGELTLAQVLYHVSVSANRLKFQHLDKEYQEQGSIGGDYLRIYSNIPIQVSNSSINPNVIKGNKYIILPARILDLPKDGGIKFITYNHLDPNCCYGPNQVNFTRTTPGFGIQRLYANPYEKPSEANPYYYLVEDEDGNGVRVYLLGMECSNISTLRIGCYSYTTASDVKSLDDVLDLPEHLIEVLKYNVISLGKFVLATSSDNINDGQNTNSSESGLSRADQLYQQQVTQQLQGGN